MREAASTLFEKIGKGWFTYNDTKEYEGFYHGLLIAMRGSGLLISKYNPDEKRMVWKLSDNYLLSNRNKGAR